MNFLSRPRVNCCINRLFATDVPLSGSTWVSQTPRTDLSTALSNPSASLGCFASIPESTFSRVISPFLTEQHLRELRLFEDFSLLVRKPALDVISVLEKSTASLATVPRFVLYGQPGCGISVQLAQLAHHFIEKNAFIFAFCNAETWLDRCSDFTPSNPVHQQQHQHAIEGEALDFPSRSAEWLTGFLKLNEPLLEKVVF